MTVVLTFGSFDVIHPGHEYYLLEAKKLGDRLVTIVAHDINIEKIKGKPPKFAQSKRVRDVIHLGITTDVIAGSQDTPLKWIGLYRPNIIALGYDQYGPFVDILENEIDRLGLDTKIVRIESHHPEKYKSSLLKKMAK